MKMGMDDKAVEAIVSMLMELQDREDLNLPLYEQQLRETDIAIQTLLNAIQTGNPHQIHEKPPGRIGSSEREIGNENRLREAGKTQDQRRVYDVLAPPLPQVRRSAEVPQKDID